MSHTVTITRTTTSTTTSAIILNSGYLKTVPGLLKLAELLLGAVCVGILSWYQSHYGLARNAEVFFLLIAVAFLIGTFCLLTSCLISISTGSIISKTIYEVVFHCVAFVLYLAAALTLLVEVNNKKYQYRYQDQYDAYLAASVIGLVVAGLYLLSTFFASRSYRGI